MRKAEARTRAFARRAKADPECLSEATTHLILAVRASRGRVLAGYWPIRTEIDPRPAMEELAATHDLCLPVVAGEGLPLAFRKWEPGAAMVAGAFGTSWPEAEEPMLPDVLIVPLAAFDRRGYRLGYGGGFYDRTLAVLRAAGPVTAIGFGYSVQEDDGLPVEPTDQPLDLMVTEHGVALTR